MLVLIVSFDYIRWINLFYFWLPMTTDENDLVQRTIALTLSHQLYNDTSTRVSHISMICASQSLMPFIKIEQLEPSLLTYDHNLFVYTLSPSVLFLNFSNSAVVCAVFLHGSYFCRRPTKPHSDVYQTVTDYEFLMLWGLESVCKSSLT